MNPVNHKVQITTFRRSVQIAGRNGGRNALRNSGRVGSSGWGGRPLLGFLLKLGLFLNFFPHFFLSLVLFFLQFTGF